jgi:hypothetical protein
MDLTEKEKGEGQMDVRNLDGRKQKELSDGKRKKDGWALQPQKKKKKEPWERSGNGGNDGPPKQREGEGDGPDGTVGGDQEMTKPTDPERDQRETEPPPKKKEKTGKSHRWKGVDVRDEKEETNSETRMEENRKGGQMSLQNKKRGATDGTMGV